MEMTVTVLIEVGGKSVTSTLEVGQEIPVGVGTQTLWVRATSQKQVVFAWSRDGLLSDHAAKVTKVKRRSKSGPVRLGGTKIRAEIR